MDLHVSRPVLVRTQTKGCTSGQEFNPTAFFKDAATGHEYAVIACNVTNGSMCSTVMDADFSLNERAIYVHTNGYPYSHTRTATDTIGSGAQTVHGRIMDTDEDDSISIDDSISVDHINRIKTDNRVSNLRRVSQSIQNQNREDRGDRIGPAPELVAIGITRMPRRVRWSNSNGEEKFVVDMPPSSKLTITGTKSTNVTVINKFRGILLKMKHHEFFKNDAILGMEEEDRLLRATLCAEHDALVKAAHQLDPKRFPDGPYSTDMTSCHEGTGMQYIDWCLAMLPLPTGSDVLHGALEREQTIEMLPEINACAIVKDGAKFKVLLDAELFDRMSSWGKIDTSCGTPRIGGQTRLNLKDIVWELYHGEPPASGYTVVPLNYQQFDLRSANMELRFGEGKSFKCPSNANIRLPDGCSSASVDGRQFMPLGVTFSGTDVLTFKELRADGTVKARRVIARPEDIGSTLRSKVLPKLRHSVAGYDERDALYQRLSAEFWHFGVLT